MSRTAPGFSSRELLPRLFDIRDDTLGFLLECARRFGDLTRFEAGNQVAYFANHPDLVRRVLQENNHNYSKNTIQYNSLATVTGRGLLTSDGPDWLRNRRLTQPAFARQRIAALDAIALPAVDSMLERWRGLEEVDIDSEMMKVTLEIVGKALFSIDLSSQAQRLTAAVLVALDTIVHRARNPITLPAAVPTTANRRFQAALRSLDEAVYRLIAERRAAGDPGSDLLGMLLRARDEETGKPMEDRQVRDEVITLLIAGHETVASALTWTWYLLSLYPAAGEKLRAEAGSLPGDGLPSAAGLDALPYTNQVFSEALRLYPPAWLITRQARAVDELDGYPIPAGALVILSPYALHRRPDFWPNPEGFDPDRFAEGSTPPRFAYIPFGGGPRLCIGNIFAQTEAALILARVSQCYRLDLLPGAHPKVDALVTLRPHGGMPMRLVRL